MMTITRPRPTVGAMAAAAAALLVLTGCSTGGVDPVNTDSAISGGTPLPVAEGATQYPLALKTDWGETELDRRPDRIAAVGLTGLDTEYLVALGVTPVFAPDLALWITDALTGQVESTFDATTYEIPVEALAAANPDLIVSIGADLADVYDDLSDIAPVLGAETSAAVDSTWQDQLREVARVLDLQEKAEEIIDSHASFFEDFQDEHDEFLGKTASYLVWQGDEYGLGYRSSPGSEVEEFLELLGFSPNPLGENFTTERIVSSENLLLADADVIILSNIGALSESELSKVTELPLWGSLEAVKSGSWVQVGNTLTGYTFDGQEHEGNLAAAIAFPGPLGQQWAAEQLAPILGGIVQ